MLLLRGLQTDLPPTPHNWSKAACQHMTVAPEQDYRPSGKEKEAAATMAPV